MIDRELDRVLMRKAVELSRESRSEEDGRIHPFVGAVIATPNGDVISTGYRGQHTPGHHAEQQALVDLDEKHLAGAVVYTTLEPCTTRGKQTPCLLRLVDHRVAEVVIGMLDPNRDIRGRGWWKFEEHGIRVRNFDYDLVQEIRGINREFINYQRGLGIIITAIQAHGSNEIEVIEDRRSGRAPIEVTTNRIIVRGAYRVRPTRGDIISLFVRRDNLYYPQAPINFDFNREKSRWECPSVWIKTGADISDNEIIIARVNEDLNVAVRQYSNIHRVLQNENNLDRWIGIEMTPEPSGFERLASLIVKGSQRDPMTVS